MKRVFSSHSEVCHIWAQQTQESGRAGNIYFEGDTIYSYGSHFPMARIYTKKGKRFALLNSSDYSNSTCKHKHHTRDALNGLMNYFDSPDVNDLNCAVNYQAAKVDFAFEAQLKRMKVTSEDDITYSLQRIEELYDECDVLRGIMGKKPIKRNQKKIDEVKSHLFARYRRYLELNTPEMIAKREQKAREQQRALEDKRKEKLAKSIATFREGGEIDMNLMALNNELLRIVGNWVETSRGAKVRLDAAKQLYKAIDNGVDVTGATVGSFTVNKVTDLGDDTLFQIGCHRILMSEASQVLGD